MNQRYILFQRAGVYYCEDRQTGKQTSLRTRDKTEAITLLHAKNETSLAVLEREALILRLIDEAQFPYKQVAAQLGLTRGSQFWIQMKKG